MLFKDISDFSFGGHFVQSSSTICAALVESIMGKHQCEMISNWAIILMGKRAGCFALFVFLVSGNCCVVLPHNNMGLSAVCECCIS